MSTKFNIVIEQGATVHFDIPLFDANNAPLEVSTGITAVAQLRESWQSVNAYSFTTSFSTDSSGQVLLNLDMDANTSMSIPPRDYVYDVRLSTTHDVIRLMEGIAQVTPAISR